MIYRIFCFFLPIILLSLSGCVSRHISSSDPEKRYLAYWDKDIVMECHGDGWRNPQCEYMAPPWETPKLMYSLMAPSGSWTVFSSGSMEEARYSFLMHPDKSNGGYLYDIKVSLQPVTDEPFSDEVRNVLEKKSHTQVLGWRVDNFKKNTSLVKNLGADKITGKLVNIAGLTCGEVSWVQHVGPSPDPEISGEWAGKGAYTKEFHVMCNLKGPELTWLLHFRYFMRLSDDLGKLVGVDDRIFNPNEAEKDLRHRLQRMFDSLKFNGLHQ